MGFEGLGIRLHRNVAPRGAGVFHVEPALHLGLVRAGGDATVLPLKLDIEMIAGQLVVFVILLILASHRDVALRPGRQAVKTSMVGG